MSRAPAARFEPTPQQLADAYAAHRRRSWPASLQAALACPLHGRLIYLHAKTRWLQAQRRAAQPAAPTTPARCGKRAAAGDTDD